MGWTMTTDSNTTNSSDTQVRQRPRRSLGLAAVRVALRGMVVLLLVFVGGFLWFTAGVGRSTPQDVTRADAIVVLTGGAERLADAFELLRQDKAGRLLITGVFASTTRAELAKLHPRSAGYIYCCVDIDKVALNTAGNALETDKWVRSKGYKRVIVVTSSWHMPRALIEMGRRLPDVELIAHPVITGRAGPGLWWHDAATFRLLAMEYVKYLAALVNMRLVQPDDAAESPSQLTVEAG
jgi:uncharacterized SAM-binding protein YcdF (DUF218 family)